jgi:hypothetical protein
VKKNQRQIEFEAQLNRRQALLIIRETEADGTLLQFLQRRQVELHDENMCLLDMELEFLYPIVVQNVLNMRKVYE